MLLFIGGPQRQPAGPAPTKPNPPPPPVANPIPQNAPEGGQQDPVPEENHQNPRPARPACQVAAPAPNPMTNKLSQPTLAARW